MEIKIFKMTGPILALVIVTPIACCIGAYHVFNNERLPCINMDTIDNHNKVSPEK